MFSVDYFSSNDCVLVAEVPWCLVPSHGLIVSNKIKDMC